MKSKSWGSAISAVVLLFMATVPAHAALFGVDGLDPAFCDLKPFRQTVVYVDDMAIEQGHSEWARTIFAKLKTSLMPGERVTVVRLSPVNGQSQEVGSACWPDYSEQRRAELAKGTYILTQSPLATLADQQKFFAAEIDKALGTIFTAARPQADVRIDPAAPPQKQIIRALASDEGRFSSSSQTIRAIVYSDMMENSDLGSVFNSQENPPLDLGKKLGSHFHRGVFYVFGVASDVENGKTIQEDAKFFWTRALKYMTATVAGFGSDLNIPNRVPVNQLDYSIEVQYQDQPLAGRMSLLSDTEGNLIDSWLLVDRLSIALVEGSFKCRGAVCRLDGTTASGIITNSPSEAVNLSGAKASLEGQIGVRGSSGFLPLKAVGPG